MTGFDELAPDMDIEFSGCQLIGNVNKDLACGEISRNHFSIDLLDFDAIKGGLVFCITIYNEPGIALQTTIKSLIDSIAHAILSSKIEPGTPITFCIIADGIARVPDTVIDFLEFFGLYLSENLDIDKDLLYFKNVFNLEDLRKNLAVYLDSNLSFIENWKKVYPERLKCSDSHLYRINNESKIQLLFLLKKENAGKLDSHWWFYHVFCSILTPDICFQIDVGTVPARDCIGEMLWMIQSEKNVAAVASSVVVPRPKETFNVLNGWQYFTFMKCMAQEWPAEVESGYLSVIPGQLSAIKWDAISYDQQGMGPLVKYFKGLGELAPHESMLYMAEDRVLCSEIIVRKTADWKLTYSPSAVAVTDPCESWAELFRQRRRWCNSYLACRINFFNKIRENLFNNERSFTKKFEALTASIYQFFLLIKDWFFPAMLFLVYQNLLQMVTNDREVTWLSHLVNVLWGFVIGSSVLAILVCIRGKLDRYSGFAFILNGVSQLLFILMSAIALIGFFKINFGLVLVFLCIYTLLIGISVCILEGREAAKNFKFLVPGMVMLAPVWLLIWVYSICNGHDSSWGTKGLHRQNNNTKSSYLSRSVFRYGYLISWVMSNFLFGWAVLMLSSALGIEVIFLIFLVFIINSVYSVFSIKKIMGIR